MTTPTYTSTSYYHLDPNSHEYDPATGKIPITTIATEVYGKEFDVLSAAARDHEMLSNDSTVVYRLETDAEYNSALEEFDSTKFYLGYNRDEGKSAYKSGMTQMEYWQTISWVTDPTVDTISEDEIASCLRLENVGGETPYTRERLEKWRAGNLTVVHVNPPEWADLEGAVFKDDFYANRAFTPSFGAVLADLIRQGRLPRGAYLLDYSW